MPVGDDALAEGYPLVPDTGEAGRVRWGALEINRTRDFVALKPRGEIAYDELVANTSSFIVANNATYDIPGLSVAPDLDIGRSYKITLKTLFNTNSSGSNRLFAMISDGSNNMLANSGYVYVPNAGYAVGAIAILRVVAAASGPFTFKGRVYRSVGVGAQQVSAQSSNPTFILVEDMG